MHDYQTEMNLLQQNRNAIYNEVRHQHLANKIHRANKLKQAKTSGKRHALNLLHLIRPHFSFGAEDPNPEPTKTHA